MTGLLRESHKKSHLKLPKILVEDTPTHMEEAAAGVQWNQTFIYVQWPSESQELNTGKNLWHVFKFVIWLSFNKFCYK